MKTEDIVLMLQKMRPVGLGLENVVVALKRESPAFIERTLIDIIKSSDTYLACEAIDVLTRVCPDAAYQGAILLVTRSDPDAVRVACETIRSHHADGAEQLLQLVLESQIDGDVRYAALSALKVVGTISSIPLLQDIAANDNSTNYEGYSARDLALECIAAITHAP